MIEASKPLVCREAGRVLLYDSRHRTVVLLLVKNTDHPRGGVWTAVGGAAKPGESTREAASRELREELHIRIPPEDLTFLLSTKSNFDFNGVPIRQTDVVYRAVFDMDRHTKISTYSEELLGAAWLTRENLMQLPRGDLVPKALWDALVSDLFFLWA